MEEAKNPVPAPRVTSEGAVRITLADPSASASSVEVLMLEICRVPSAGTAEAKAVAAARAEIELAKRRDDVRRRAVARIKKYRRENDCTWTLAERLVAGEMWSEFAALGLRASRWNIHRIRYNPRFAAG